MYPIYCINLHNRIDRKQHAKEQFKKLNIPLDSVIFPYFTKDLSGGSYGCFRSHMYIWKDFLEAHPEKPYCLVLEDDFLINSSIDECKQVLNDATAFLKETRVDILHLHNIFIPTSSYKSLDTFQKGYGLLAHAYFITRDFIASVTTLPDAIGDQIDYTLSFNPKSPIYSEHQYYTHTLYITQYANKSDNYLNTFDSLTRVDHVQFLQMCIIFLNCLKGCGLNDTVIHRILQLCNATFVHSPSKETTKVCVNEITDILRTSKLHDETLACIIRGIHHVFVNTVFIAIAFSKIDICYYIFISLFLGIIFLNYYFHGCIFTRIEMEFLGSSWKGDIYLLISKLLGIEFSNSVMNTFIKYTTAILCTIMIVRLYAVNKLFATALCAILTPLLFRHPLESLDKLYSF